MLIYLEGMFVRGYTTCSMRERVGRDELSFRREIRTRRVVQKQSVCGRAWGIGECLMSTYDAAVLL